MDDAETTTGTEAAEPGGAPDMAEGVLEGGWPFIWAAYLITWSFLGLYTVYVNVRLYVSNRARAKRDAERAAAGIGRGGLR